MSLEGNKALIKQFWLDVFNRGNLELADELFAPEHVIHHPYLSQESHGAQPMKAFVWVSRKVSPDLEIDIEDEIAEGDKVVTRWTARGTIADKLRGTDADGEVAASGISVFYVSAGQIRETWIRLEHDLNESQKPVPKDEIQGWLSEDIDAPSTLRHVSPSTEEDSFTPFPWEWLLRICCLWNRHCCHDEPRPPREP